MKLAVFGASGGTGQQILAHGLAAGHSITALVRNPEAIQPRSELQIIAGNCNDQSAVDDVVLGQDAVLCALGGRPWRRRERVCSSAMLNIIPAMRKHQVRRLIAMSTFGAGDSRPLVNPLPRALIFGLVLRSEVADKEAMEALLVASDLDWTVVRVGILTDGPRTGRYRTRDDGSIRGMGKVSRNDVADFMLLELRARAWIRRRPVLMY